MKKCPVLVVCESVVNLLVPDYTSLRRLFAIGQYIHSLAFARGSLQIYPPALSNMYCRLDRWRAQRHLVILYTSISIGSGMRCRALRQRQLGFCSKASVQYA